MGVFFNTNEIDYIDCLSTGKEAMIQNEVSILKKVKHPNIVELYEDFHYSHELCLVMELVSVSSQSVGRQSESCFFFKNFCINFMTII